MESEFSSLSPEERVVRCLEHARSSLNRADMSEDAGRKAIHANLAGCWHSAARQFETLSLLLEEVKARNAARTAQIASAPTMEMDRSLVLATGATGFLISPDALPAAV